MSPLSPRETFDRQLRQLLDEVLVFGSMVEQAVMESVEALKKRDLEASRRIYDGDQIINAKRFKIEQDSLILIATQQPMARDLRVLASILEINTELERIGDYAKGIARINIMLGDQALIGPVNDLELMARQGLSMLHRALGAFVARDLNAAYSIPKEDEAVDTLYNHVRLELVDLMIADANNIDKANYMMWAAHNLERLADRVTNICERIIFIVTGELRELDAEDDADPQRLRQER